MFFSKIEKEKFWMSEYEVLAQYNAEVSRGIEHTVKWKDRMVILQKEYDDRLRRFAEKGITGIL